MRPGQIPSRVAVIVEERSALAAALAFVDGAAAGWQRPELCAWVDEHLALAGRMARPQTIFERPAGPIALEPESDVPADDDRVKEALTAARSRVVSTLRGFLSQPCDDRFLNSALFRGRVERRTGEAGSEWVARPSPDDALSEIVLSLFAADILMRREVYERSLCVCDLCGRISFERDLTTARGCPEHVPVTEGTSGFRRWSA